jgi:hypothetical protein
MSNAVTGRPLIKEKTKISALCHNWLEKTETNYGSGSKSTSIPLLVGIPLPWVSPPISRLERSP